MRLTIWYIVISKNSAVRKIWKQCYFYLTKCAFIVYQIGFYSKNYFRESYAKTLYNLYLQLYTTTQTVQQYSTLPTHGKQIKMQYTYPYNKTLQNLYINFIPRDEFCTGKNNFFSNISPVFLTRNVETLIKINLKQFKFSLFQIIFT